MEHDGAINPDFKLQGGAPHPSGRNTDIRQSASCLARGVAQRCREQQPGWLLLPNLWNCLN